MSARAAIECRVLVTDRMRPLRLAGQTVHQIGLPYHWARGGAGAVVSGDSANDLLGVTLEPNVAIQESKVGTCDIRPGRRPEGEELLRLVEDYRSRSGTTTETGNVRLDRGPDGPVELAVGPVVQEEGEGTGPAREDDE